MYFEDITTPLCNKCANWSLFREEDGTEKVQCMDDKVQHAYPNQYPEGRHVPPQPAGRLCSDKVLPPVKLNTEWMMKAVRSGYFGVRLGNWGKPAAKEYFRTCNIKTKTAQSTINYALEDKRDSIVNVERVEPNFWNWWIVLEVLSFIFCRSMACAME